MKTRRQAATLEVISSDDDEAPEEVSQALAREDARERHAAMPEVKRRRKRARQEDDAEERAVEMPSQELLKQAALQREMVRETETRAEGKAQDVGPRIIGGTKPDEREGLDLAPRSDNVQLVVTKIVNGKPVFMYQDKGDVESASYDEEDSQVGIEEEEEEEEEEENIDASVDNFVHNFLKGKRHRRVHISKLRKVQPASKGAQQRRNKHKK